MTMNATHVTIQVYNQYDLNFGPAMHNTVNYNCCGGNGQPSYSGYKDFLRCIKWISTKLPTDPITHQVARHALLYNYSYFSNSYTSQKSQHFTNLYLWPIIGYALLVHHKWKTRRKTLHPNRRANINLP